MPQRSERNGARTSFLAFTTRRLLRRMSKEINREGLGPVKTRKEYATVLTVTYAEAPSPVVSISDECGATHLTAAWTYPQRGAYSH